MIYQLRLGEVDEEGQIGKQNKQLENKTREGMILEGTGEERARNTGVEIASLK